MDFHSIMAAIVSVPVMGGAIMYCYGPIASARPSPSLTRSSSPHIIGSLGYRDLGGAYLDQIHQTHTMANLKRRLERLGYIVQLHPKETVAVVNHQH